MAALHVLLSLGTRVVLPPPFLCCGFPAHANAKTDQHSRTVLRDTILFSQIREMFSHLHFDGCVVTCGTCREGLEGMEAGKLFGGRIVDLAGFAAERGLRLEGAGAGGALLYHPPCHDSLDGKAKDVLRQIGGFAGIETVPHCCSEAGTLALSRPDITDAMLHRKRAALAEVLGERGSPRGAVVLTNCPSCLQGLGRNRALGVEPRHLAVELAERMSGPGWLDLFRAQAAAAHAVHF
jgi:Fe-S oxidoreductase